MKDREFSEKLIQRLQIEFARRDRSGIYGLTQTKMAFNSNRIEGTRLSERQTVSLFETGTLYADGEVIISKDIEEMTGHFALFNEMLNTYQEDLTEDLIKRYHFVLRSGVFEDKLNGYPVGEYKNRANRVSDITVSLPEDVPLDMASMLGKYHQMESVDEMTLARLHADFELIHPFQDGNGRTGRMLLFKECLKWKIVPFVFEDQYKEKYYIALHNAQTQDDITALVDLINFEQERYYEMSKHFVFTVDELLAKESNTAAEDDSAVMM